MPLWHKYYLFLQTLRQGISFTPSSPEQLREWVLDKFLQGNPSRLLLKGGLLVYLSLALLSLSFAAMPSLPICFCSTSYTYLPSKCYDSLLPQKRCSFFGKTRLEVTIIDPDPTRCRGRYHTKVCFMPTTH